jgi:hypothetical protein
MKSLWYKKDPKSKIWWKDIPYIGVLVFSFDRKKEIYFFRDYPEALTPEEKAIFDKEEPGLAELKK